MSSGAARAGADAERERNHRAQRGGSLAHRAAMGYPAREPSASASSALATGTVPVAPKADPSSQ
ncbi:hypothetical protein, partial [Streptomyces microflavus]